MRNGLKFDDVMAVVRNRPAGIEMDEKAAWVKLQAPDSNNKVYISKRDIVRQIDLSGFGAGMAGTIPVKRKNGRVEAHLDLDDPNALQHLEQILEMMAQEPEERGSVQTPREIRPLPSRGRATSPPPSIRTLGADDEEDERDREEPRRRRPTDRPHAGR